VSVRALSQQPTLNQPADRSLYGPVTAVRGSRTMPPPARILSRFASGHGSTGGADDLTRVLYGDRSYRATSDGAGNNKTIALPSTPVLDWSGYYVRIAVMVDDPTKLGQLQLWMDSITNAAWFATIATTGTATQVFAPNTWTIITIPRANFAVSGTATPVWGTVSRPRLVFKDRAPGTSGAVSVNWAAIEHLPEQASVYPNGVFMLEADDGFASHKTLLRPMLDSLGVPCTYNPIIDRVTGGAAGVTVADLRDMQDKSGWQISAHATTQAFHDNTSATAAQASTDFAAQKKWLHDNGFHAGADDYALCPATGTNVFATSAMRDAVSAHWRSARMFNGFVETVIPGEPLSFRSLGFSGNTNAQLQTNIDAAAGPGGVFSLSIHDVLTGSTNGTSAGLAAIAVNNLQTVINYALGKGMLPRTRADWLALR
jgi:hypothetical protein